VLHAEVVTREARITLGQLPAELRERVRAVRIFGPRDLAQQAGRRSRPAARTMALKTDVVKAYAGDEFGVHSRPTRGVAGLSASPRRSSPDAARPRIFAAARAAVETAGRALHLRAGCAPR